MSARMLNYPSIFYRSLISLPRFRACFVMCDAPTVSPSNACALNSLQDATILLTRLTVFILARKHKSKMTFKLNIHRNLDFLALGRLTTAPRSSYETLSTRSLLHFGASYSVNWSPDDSSKGTTSDLHNNAKSLESNTCTALIPFSVLAFPLIYLPYLTNVILHISDFIFSAPCLVGLLIVI